MKDEQPADLWLQVKKTREPKLAPPSDLLSPWVPMEALSISTQVPELRRSILQPREPAPGSTEPPPPDVIHLTDHPEIESLWSKYLTAQWKPWADAHRRWHAVHTAYSRLFSIHQTLVKKGEELELLVGIGFLCWRTTHDQIVRRHLLTTRAALQFDASQGVFSLVAPPEGARLQLELDMLEADEAPSLEEQKQIETLLMNADSELWDRTVIEPVLKAVAHSVSDLGVYDSAASSVPKSDGAPRVVLAPALILRKRSTRGYMSVLNSILSQIESGSTIPDAMAQMTGLREPLADSGDSDRESTDSPSDEIHFPLPANDEQIEIVRKLRGRSGVHVQGPPGTGKSHTIANLICHLLASGKRVLVTAQTPRALKVLHDKIPADLQPLCVSLLGNDKSSFDHLEKCVRDIVGRFESFRASDYKTRIEASKSDLRLLRLRESEVKRLLRTLRERETLEHSIVQGTYSGTAAAIARRLNDEAPLYDWLDDEIPFSAECPLSSDEAVRLLAHTRILSSSSEADKSLGIPDADSVRELIARVRPHHDSKRSAEESIRARAAVADQQSASLASLEDPEVIGLLLRAVIEYESALTSLLSRQQGWVSIAIKDILSGRDSRWRSLRDACPADASYLLQAAKRRDAIKVSWGSTSDRLRVFADAQDLKAYLEEGGSLGLLARFKGIVRRTKYLREQVAVDGRPAASTAVLASLLEAIQFDRTLEDMWSHWSDLATRVDGPASRQASILSEQLVSLEDALKLGTLHGNTISCLGVFAGVSPPDWFDPVAVRKFANSMQQAEAMSRRRVATVSIASALAPLRAEADLPNSHPLTTAILTALDDGDLSQGLLLVSEIERIARLRTVQHQVAKLQERLQNAAPGAARALSTTPEQSGWDARCQRFTAAWNHARAKSWLRETFGEATELSCESELHRLVERISATTARLAADLAWLHALGRMSEEHRRHFVAWSQAVKSLGKGTGKYAEKHRRDAQYNLSQCRDAIPAWIMPLHHVYDSVEPTPEAFDAIIVDEASQCGLDSRILTFLTKQLVVVGDDKQISPEVIGLERTDVFRLIEEHLGDVPQAESFQPERSLFDFAELWFGERIVLQEHFRCVPEIIRFSSDLCYQTKPLIPLRQYPPDRLRPLVDRRVNGVRAGSGSHVVNEAEAAALVEAVARCSKDPRYEGMTFGVISLQGEAQAKRIERMLLDRLEPRDIEKRKLVCGDAYSFQGDERNVVFLSMVAAPNEAIGPLTKDSDTRRFNVAASRAKDQMWLFRSVDASDLNQKCCRRMLLDYVTQPLQQTFRGMPIDDWRKQAASRGRQMGQQPAPFESWFELDVFLKLVDRGFRVVPQFQVAAARIDLMIEGLQARLAVECNGEHWHGPDRWDADQDRQRRLERVGLRFFTVWESAFRRDPDETLEPLWSKLATLGVRPLGLNETTQLDVEGYVPSESVTVTACATLVAPTSQPDRPSIDQVNPSRSSHDGPLEDSRRTDDAPVEAPKAAPLQAESRPPSSALARLALALAELEDGPDASTGSTVDGSVSAPESGLFSGVSGMPGPSSRVTTKSLFGNPQESTPPQLIDSVQPYSEWTPRLLPDPRTATRKELLEGLREIVSVEGPVLCLRAYQLFAKAAGVSKVHSAVRARFNQTVQAGVESGQFALADGYGEPYQMNRFVRLKGSSELRLRTLGPRSIHEVPPDELAANIRLVNQKHSPASRERLFRLVLESYGLVRATEATLATLEEALIRAKPVIVVGAGE